MERKTKPLLLSELSQRYLWVWGGRKPCSRMSMCPSGLWPSLIALCQRSHLSSISHHRVAIQINSVWFMIVFFIKAFVVIKSSEWMLNQKLSPHSYPQFWSNQYLSGIIATNTCKKNLLVQHFEIEEKWD